MISYNAWKALPDDYPNKALWAIVAYFSPGQEGPWPVNVEPDEIVRLAREAMAR